MRASLTLLLALTACAESPVESAPPSKAEGHTILVGCRQGECGWARIGRIDTVETVAQGQLRRMTMRSGTSTHLDGNIPDSPAQAEIEWQAADQSDYAFCSKERPAFAFPDEGGGLIVHFLDLFDLGGYQMNSAKLYMRVCHDFDGVPDEAKLHAWGYRPKTRSEQIEGAKAEDLTRF